VKWIAVAQVHVYLGEKVVREKEYLSAMVLVTEIAAELLERCDRG
jgi:hypothetical protein